MKKILLSLAVVAAFSTCTFAQITAGAKGGFNFANFGGDAEDTDMRVSIHLGGYLNYAISDKLSFQPELLYSSVGCKVKESDSYQEFGVQITEKYEATTKLNYLSLPLLVQYKLGTVNVLAGPQLGFFMGGKVKEEYTYTAEGYGSDSESDTHDADGVNTLDLGFNIGLGANFDKINVSARYSAGLTNIVDGDDKITNNVLQLSVGYVLYGAE